MADFVKGLFGGQKPAPAAAGGDDDFADYAGAPSPEPASIESFATASAANTFATGTVSSGSVQVPYTKWYRVWERTSLNDFRTEMFVLPFIIVVVILHAWGKRRNRNKALHWMRSHAPVLQQEYAQVGYTRPQASADDVSSIGLLKATEKAQADAVNPENMVREKKADEYMSYATGRLNVVFTDIKITLVKRYNPFIQLGEHLIAMFFESLPPTQERMEATTYAFDGREAQIAPGYGKGDEKKVPNSVYDGFVFAIVHKDLMKRLRDDRYDLSLTTTKDHAKLPAWTTVMSESAEVTDALLTPELVKAVHDAGDAFEALIVTDQPLDQPKKIDETAPKKRISLSTKLQSTGTPYTSTLPLFQYFLRLPDILVNHGRFRPEALRRIKATREEQIAKIKKVDDDEKAEERKLTADKKKKDERDRLLSGMSADDQRKYLDKERERGARRKQKKSTVKG